MATLKQKLIQLAMTYPTPKMTLPLRIQAMVRESVVDAVEKGTVTSQEAVRGSVQNCMGMYEEMYNKGYLRGIIEEDQRAAQQPPAKGTTYPQKRTQQPAADAEEAGAPVKRKRGFSQKDKGRVPKDTTATEGKKRGTGGQEKSRRREEPDTSSQATSPPASLPFSKNPRTQEFMEEEEQYYSVEEGNSDDQYYSAHGESDGEEK
jgi:hypothetical protein